MAENVSMVVVYLAGGILTFSLSWQIGVTYILVYVLANIIYAWQVCPYCSRSHESNCSSGYHHLAKFFKRKENVSLKKQYRKGVLAMIPIWFIPPIAGILLLIKKYSTHMLIVVLIFCIVSYIVLPTLSKGRCSGSAAQNQKNLI